MGKLQKNIRIILGILIVLGIFVFLFVNSFIEKSQNNFDLINIKKYYKNSIPQNFSPELFDPNIIGATDIQVSDDEKIVGFTLPFDSLKSMNLMKKYLLDKSWQCVDMVENNNANFYKNKGFYKWMFINCVDCQGSTSVVITFE